MRPKLARSSARFAAALMSGSGSGVGVGVGVGIAGGCGVTEVAEEGTDGVGAAVEPGSSIEVTEAEVPSSVVTVVELVTVEISVGSTTVNSVSSTPPSAGDRRSCPRPNRVSDPTAIRHAAPNPAPTAARRRRLATRTPCCNRT